MRSALLIFLLWLGCYAAASEHFKRYSEPADAVLPGALPWVVLMTDTYRYFSAVLISNKYLITSAHALYLFSKTDCLKANFKSANKPFTVKAKRFLLHPEFNSSLAQDLANDFAIIELDQSVEGKDKSIELPVLDVKKYRNAELININPMYAAGYAGSESLKKVELTWSLASTERLYKLFYSGTAEPGDSGGPLFYSKNNSYYLIGVQDSAFLKAGYLVFFEPISKYSDFLFRNTDIESNDEVSLLESWEAVNCPTDDSGFYIAEIAGSTAVLFSAVITISCIMCLRKK